MAEAPKSYKGKDGQVYQLFFKDKEDEDEEEVDVNGIRALTTSPVDPYSDLTIHPPTLANRTNPFRTTQVSSNPFRTTQVTNRTSESATVVKRLAGSEDVVLFEKKKLEEDSEEESTEMDALLRGSSADAIAVSMESIDIGKDNAPPTKRFLIKTDSDLDLLVHEPSRFEEIRARGRWFWTSLQKCPPWRSYMNVVLVIAGVFLLYAILIIVILEVLGTG